MIGFIIEDNCRIVKEKMAPGLFWVPDETFREKRKGSGIYLSLSEESSGTYRGTAAGPIEGQQRGL